MKRKIYLMMTIPLILLSVIEIDAQQWVKINTTFIPSGNHSLYEGMFFDEFNGWYADNGNIFKTTDGGFTWHLNLNSGINTGGFDYLFFVDSLNGWVRFQTQEDSSFIYKTTNSGKDWQIIKTPTIYKFHFIDFNNGIGIYNDIIYKTSDGGITWKKIDLEPYAGKLLISSIFFLNNNFGWVVGSRQVGNPPGDIYPIILSTKDGGKTWLLNNITTFYNAHLTTSAWVDSLNGIIGDSRGYYYTTIDGGKNWALGTSIVSIISNIFFVNKNEAWMTGATGFIGYSTDKGKTWEKVISPTNNPLGKISFVKNNTVGFIFAGQNTLLRYDKSVDVANNSIKQIPTEPILHQNYPNPFNSSTILTFELPEDNFMELKLYDLLGQEIAVIEKGFMNRGEHKVLLNAQTLSSGTYFCLLKQGNYFSKIKLVLIK